MKNIEMGYHHHREPTFPFAKGDFVDESLPKRRGGGEGTTSSVNVHPPWHIPNTCDNRGRDAICESFSSLQSSYSGCFNTKNTHETPSNASWIHHIQSILPMEGYNWFGSSPDITDTVIHFPSYGSLNAGSLVLDSSRGELVNALKMTPKEILEAKALAASRSHSEAERRRRERINSHLATLRTIVPNSLKSDKASLLAQVIDQVKRLKRQVSDVYRYDSMPSEIDELIVESDQVSEVGKGGIMIRASLCCDDRPDLMTDLKHALDTLQLRTVKMEMSTLGGRIKNDFIVAPVDAAAEHHPDLLIKRVQEALRVVMERPGRGEVLLQGKFSKRQRLASLEGQVDC